MAKKITLVDDLDGETTAAESVEFSVDGVAYEIDLSEKHAAELRTVFEKYVSAGRRVGGRKRRNSTSASGYKAADVRTWAEANGVEVPLRGRIPATVLEQYFAATAS